MCDHAIDILSYNYNFSKILMDRRYKVTRLTRHKRVIVYVNLLRSIDQYYYLYIDDVFVNPSSD